MVSVGIHIIRRQARCLARFHLRKGRCHGNARNRQSQPLKPGALSWAPRALFQRASPTAQGCRVVEVLLQIEWLLCSFFLPVTGNRELIKVGLKVRLMQTRFAFAAFEARRLQRVGLFEIMQQPVMVLYSKVSKRNDKLDFYYKSSDKY